MKFGVPRARVPEHQHGRAGHFQADGLSRGRMIEPREDDKSALLQSGFQAIERSVDRIRARLGDEPLGSRCRDRRREQRQDSDAKDSQIAHDLILPGDL